jgi:hypothetical protein
MSVTNNLKNIGKNLSKKDFRNKIVLTKKEISETEHLYGN